MHTPDFSYMRQNWDAIPIELMEKDVQKMEADGADDAPIYRKLLEEAKLKRGIDPPGGGSDKNRGRRREMLRSEAPGSEGKLSREMLESGNLPVLREASRAENETSRNPRDAGIDLVGITNNNQNDEVNIMAKEDPRAVIKELQTVKSALYEKLQRENRDTTETEKQILNELDEEIVKWQSKPLPSLMGTGAGFTGTRSTGPFPSFGQQLQAIANAGKPGQKPDNRLYEIRAQAGLNETIPSEGGFILQQDFSNELLKGVYETNILASRCNRFKISGNANSIKLPAVDETSRANGSRWGGVQGYWKDEAAAKVASQPKFRQMELTLHKIIGLCYATDELLQDASVLEKVIFQAFAGEISFLLDLAIYNGSGAGQPLGFMNSGALVTVDAQVGQDPDTVVTENLLDMYSRMPARNRKNAIWLINQSIEPQLYSMSLAVGAGGGPVFMPSGGLSVQPYATLFGRPVIPIEQASPLGDLGDIVFADMSAMILADKGGIQTDMSIHVEFLTDQSVNTADDYRYEMAA